MRELPVKYPRTVVDDDVTDEEAMRLLTWWETLPARAFYPETLRITRVKAGVVGLGRTAVSCGTIGPVPDGWVES